MNLDVQHNPTLPDIGTSWLVLSHGTWIACTIGCAAISTAIVLYGGEQWKTLSVGWLCAALVLTLWTLYAVYSTYKAAQFFKHRVFDNRGFLFLAFTVLIVAGLVVWTMVDVASLV